MGSLDPPAPLPPRLRVLRRRMLLVIVIVSIVVFGAPALDARAGDISLVQYVAIEIVGILLLLLFVASHIRMLRRDHRWRYPAAIAQSSFVLWMIASPRWRGVEDLSALDIGVNAVGFAGLVGIWLWQTAFTGSVREPANDPDAGVRVVVGSPDSSTELPRSIADRPLVTHPWFGEMLIVGVFGALAGIAAAFTAVTPLAWCLFVGCGLIAIYLRDLIHSTASNTTASSR